MKKSVFLSALLIVTTPLGIFATPAPAPAPAPVAQAPKPAAPAPAPAPVAQAPKPATPAPAPVAQAPKPATPAPAPAPVAQAPKPATPAPAPAPVAQAPKPAAPAPAPQQVVKEAPKTEQKAQPFSVASSAAEIDRIVEAMLTEQKLKPNADVDDATFVRRIYLDVIGRIPTIEESEVFLASKDGAKRSKLISALLSSDGHVSHMYNFWADMLRVNTGLGIGATEADAAYQIWIKEAVRSNKHYDQMVRELVSARGNVWDNGAVAYYIRDRGMPLDNMSTTIRIFLGTRLECAQCHDHPFDKWTQMDYFKMAAFSYGMGSRGYDEEHRNAFYKEQAAERQAAVENATGLKGFPQFGSQDSLDKTLADAKRVEAYVKQFKIDGSKFRDLAAKSLAAYTKYNDENKGVSDAMRDIYQPLRYITTSEVKSTLKLPHDYKYDDAKPYDKVTAGTMFGAVIDPKNLDDSAIESYANWMVSKDNPTFTRVIANRLWKRVFGQGVFEPLDDLTDATQVSNPKLLSYLETMMKNLDYDVQKYLEVLYNTKSFQRAAYTKDVPLGEPYYFVGPLLRRMSAEQIWDSIVALALPEADSYRPNLARQLTTIERARQMGKALDGRDQAEYTSMMKQVAKGYDTVRVKEDATRKKITAAQEKGDKQLVAELQRELSAATTENRKSMEMIAFNGALDRIKDSSLLASMGMMEMQMDSSGAMSSMSAMSGGAMEMSAAPGGNAPSGVLLKLPTPRMPKMPDSIKEEKDKKAWNERRQAELRTYNSLIAPLARASELPSPAPRGHFLREFGQSDREVIDNSSSEASVPQALNLLNGSMVDALTNPFSVFGRRVFEAENVDQKIDMVFEAMLSRKPTQRERELAQAEVKVSGDAAFPGMVWSIMNTQQFIFVQ